MNYRCSGLQLAHSLRGMSRHRCAKWGVAQLRTLCGGGLPGHQSSALLSTNKHGCAQVSSESRESIVGTYAVKRKELIPEASPPSDHDLRDLYRFVEESQNLVVVTGAGISTESGIPDYRSPNGAYSSGFKPITHQEFLRTAATRRRYWARSYAGWRQFMAAEPGPTHRALAQLESKGRVMRIITQNVDRLHHRAGSTNAIELHGTTHRVFCLGCGELTDRHKFQQRVCDLNPDWAAAVEALEKGEPGSDASFGMKQRPDGDIEIDSRFFQEDFLVPACEQCGGVLKPDVVFFGDNVPKARAEEAMELVMSSDAVLAVGSSLTVMSVFRLIRAAIERGSPVGIVNIGPTRADELASLKIEARSGEVLSRLLTMGSLAI
ncbi:NAD-dependent protein deacetylase/lipoamidase [Marchantia polymorpha subsp. ruderalis]|uniref:NAD-dependent protein deacylase n=2 Tax=Marchantia polymorpha TaxID=3197 RepID=A0AAF6BH70_MARPO|nr:hypothetical protein MARPO_0093s0042 [Marchantia polymorpha]BBN11354.1 hypothetical protein Mp_5g11200 [Marchantia polymorpha subsp. ruderalis]|eukprot:PTQ32963.1 hypothetical protein MARPO_0093s0042 [Marchantia polymorpha]